jgi:hypothetical protein
MLALLARGASGNLRGDIGPSPTATAEPTETATLEPTSTPTAIPTATPIPSPTRIPNYLAVTVGSCGTGMYPIIYVTNLYPSPEVNYDHDIYLYFTLSYGATSYPLPKEPTPARNTIPPYHLPVDFSPTLQQRNVGPVHVSLRGEWEGRYPQPAGTWSGVLQPCA